MNFGFSVTILVPEQYNSIQLAIESSNNGDSIIVSPGQYFENIDFIGKEITVTSLYEINNDSTIIGLTIIDASENGSVATFKNNETNNSVLQGLLFKTVQEIVRTQMAMDHFTLMVEVSTVKKVALPLKIV